jgi:PAS domain S-box-containing protein
MNDRMRRVLIVEDDAVSAELERRVLSRAGFLPQVAASLTEAREQLGTGEFAALLLDYRLPDGDAWDLVAAARAMEPPVPVILVTAMGNETVAAEAMLHGVTEYIRKAEGFHDQLSGAVERAAQQAQIHEELRRNDSLFRTIADHATDAIVLLDRNDAILWASAAAEQVFTDRQKALIGRRLEEFLHPEDLPVWRRSGQWTEAAGRRFRCRGKDGQYLSFEPTFRTIGDGESVRTLGVLRDVTERLALEERLRHHQRLEAIGQLTGGIAHDFNNLLAVVIANLDVLRETLDSASLAHELAGDALDAALRGAELTARLLAFSRRQPLRPEVCDVNETITAMVKLLGRTLGEDITIELALESDLWPVLVDRMQLETALTNLATNARDAMPHGGSLTITTRNVVLDPASVAGHPDLQPDDYAQIEVRDTGSGIPPEIIDRIFEPFFTTKDIGKGTGLGLSMVFGFINQSGGHISACSETGEGSAIRLYLPRTASAEVAGWLSQADAAPAGDGRAILLVEDNAKLREITARQLREAGHSVLEACDASTALAILQSDAPVDLLFSDIIMPGEQNGYDLCRIGAELRPGIKVLLTSGFSDAPESEAAPTGYSLLHKPYRRTSLLQSIRAALDGKTAEGM